MDTLPGLDLDTFLTTLYVLVDDYYQSDLKVVIAGMHHGAPVRMSDSEVLTVALAGMWRSGTPWHSERGVVRWMNKHGRGYFPHMLKRSAFNARVRQRWGMFVRWQACLASRLTAGQHDGYEIADCVPMPAFSSAQALREQSHALADSDQGHGGTHGGWYYGHKVLLMLHDSGTVTGFTYTPASCQDRWLLNTVLAVRDGWQAAPTPPGAPQRAKAERALPPLDRGYGCPDVTAGVAHAEDILADKGFNSQRWATFWRTVLHANVIPVPPSHTADYAAWTKSLRRCLASLRQVIETVNSIFSSTLPLKQLGARSRWGLLTRLSIVVANMNVGLWLNRTLHRPAFAFATLID